MTRAAKDRRDSSWAAEAAVPFVLRVAGDPDAPTLGSVDRIVIEIADEDGKTWISLPQFDLEFCAPDDPAVAGDELVKRLIAFYAGLRELPAQFITEVEREQLKLIEELFLPWFAQAMGREPGYFNTPPSAARELVRDKDLQPA